ncbi:MAG: hypothetical protein PHY34_04520, partial [Patescibacteria group bacterium]|nr:hypothetical protein [Patescibacteria group bacterium]
MSIVLRKTDRERKLEQERFFWYTAIMNVQFTIASKIERIIQQTWPALSERTVGIDVAYPPD